MREAGASMVFMLRSSHRRGSGASPGDAAPTGGAGGVVFNAAGQVLVLGHRSGTWVFPKGHIESGEAPLQAALREVEEEAGVRAEAPSPHRSYSTDYVNDRRERRHITWFVLRTSDTHPILREAQFPEAAFLEPDLALRRLSFAQDRALLEEVIADLPGGRP